jgi:hypothetical protein
VTVVFIEFTSEDRLQDFFAPQIHIKNLITCF